MPRVPAALAGTNLAVPVGLVILLVVAVVAPVAVTPAAALGQIGQMGPGGRISLASQTPWVEPDGAFELRVDLAGVRRPEDLALEISVREAVTSRSQFSQTIEGRLLGDELWRRGPTPLADIQLDDAGAARVTVPIASSPTTAANGERPVVLADAGVHPVRVVLHDAEAGAEVDSFTTHLVRARRDDARPLDVAWVQPVTAPLALQPDGTASLDDLSRVAVATAAAALGASDVPLTVVPRPETLEALAASAPDLLDQLGATVGGRQVVAGPYVEIDTAALLAAGLGDVVDAQGDRGAAVVERLVGSADRRTWVSQRPLDATTLTSAPDAERLVLPEVAMEPLEQPLTLANPFLVEDGRGRLVETAVIDPGLQSHFSGADPVLAAHHLLADLAVLAYDSPGLDRGVVVQPPPEWTPSADLLATVLPALGSGSVVRPVTLDELFDVVPRASAVGGGELVRALRPQPASPVFDATELLRTGADVDSFVTVVGSGDTAVELARRLVLASSAASLPDSRRAAYLEGARRVIGERLDAVGILSEGSFRLTSREATIPLTLVNDLDVDVEVTLALESDKLDFVGPGRTTTGSAVIPLELGPGSTPVMVPVEARTSGDFPLFIELRSPDDRLTVATARLTVRSTFLSGVGVLVSAGAGLFLCGWWARHWRSVRRDRRLVSPPAPT